MRALRIAERPWANGSPPVVSVCCTTYQHARFIRKALDGFLMQETTFSVEIVVRDDASTDGTAEIVADYASRYPGTIRTVLNKRNVHADGVRSLAECLRHTQGTYVAVCEGDDYWTDPHKLQRQVGQMEADAGLVGVFHACVIEDDAGAELPNYYPEPPTPIVSTRAMIWRHYVPTCALLFRRSAYLQNRYDHVPHREILSGDRFLELNLSLFGNFRFSHEKMAVHVKHTAGITQSPAHRDLLRRRLSYVRLFEELEKSAVANGKDPSVFHPKCAMSRLALSLFHLRGGRVRRSLADSARGLSYVARSPIEFYKQRIRRDDQ